MGPKGPRYSMGLRGSKDYIDCSEFSQCVYKDAGITIPGTAAAQYQASTPIDKSQWQPGDLLFFRARSGPRSKLAASHVGVFIGYDNKGNPIMRHASAGQGKNPSVVDVNLNEFTSMRFLGARRPKG